MSNSSHGSSDDGCLCMNSAFAMNNDLETAIVL